MNQYDSHRPVPDFEYMEAVGLGVQPQPPPLQPQPGMQQLAADTHPVKLSFTIKEGRIQALESIRDELQARFNTTVEVERTSYAPTPGGENIRWVEVKGRDLKRTRYAKVQNVE